jgi:hypothetical protein
MRDDATGGNILFAATDCRGNLDRFYDLFDGRLFGLFPDRFEDKGFIGHGRSSTGWGRSSSL